MKRLAAIIAIFMIAAFVGSAYAGGSMSEGTLSVIHNSKTGRPEFMTVLFTCTADSATGAFTSTETSTVLTNAIKGWALDKIQIDGTSGTYKPKEDSDLYVYDAYVFDILGGNGADNVDNTAKRSVVPASGGQNKQQPIVGALTTAISGNDVTRAVVYVRYYFVNPN